MQGEVVRLLHRVGAEQGEAGLPEGHDVGVVAEDRQGVGGDGAGGHVHAEAGQLAGDLVHVRDHQEQALRRREGRRQAAGLQRPVDGRDGAGLRLHLGDVRDTAPQMLPAAVGRPLVAPLAHRRGRGDGIDDDHLVGAVGHRRDRLVGVHGDHAACHAASSWLTGKWHVSHTPPDGAWLPSRSKRPASACTNR